TSGQRVLTLQGHTNTVSCVCFSPEGDRLASASWDGSVRVWNTRGGPEALPLEGHPGPASSVGFSWDGKRIVARCAAARTGGAQGVRCWDLHTGAEIVPCTDRPPSANTLSARSADGRWTAFASGNRILVRRSNSLPALGRQHEDDFWATAAW